LLDEPEDEEEEPEEQVAAPIADSFAPEMQFATARLDRGCCCQKSDQQRPTPPVPTQRLTSTESADAALPLQQSTPLLLRPDVFACWSYSPTPHVTAPAQARFCKWLE